MIDAQRIAAIRAYANDATMEMDSDELRALCDYALAAMEAEKAWATYRSDETDTPLGPDGSAYDALVLSMIRLRAARGVK